MQPPHRAVAALQHQLAAAVADGLAARPAEAVLEPLSRRRADDAEGLAALLAEMQVRTPADLVALARLLAASGAYAALTWSRGMRTEAGTPFTADDVRRAAWLHARWTTAAEPDAAEPAP